MNAANTLRIIGSVCDFLILHDWRCFENIYTHPFFVIVVIKENGFFTHHTLTPNVWVFSAHQFCNSLDTNWVPYNCIHFWDYLPGVIVRLHSFKTSVPQHFFQFRFNHSPGSLWYHTSVPFGCKTKGPTYPTSDWIISYNGSPNPETFTYVYQFIIKDIIQDRDEQPYKEVRSEGTESRNICPQGVGVHPPPLRWTCSPFRTLYFRDFYGGILMIISSISSPSPLPAGQRIGFKVPSF